MKEDYNTSIHPRLKEMQIGETINFPIRRFGSVKNSCSCIGLQYGRKFTTHLDRKKEIIEVTRIK